MTEKQKRQVEKRILYFGLNKVKAYITKFFPDANMNNLTKTEAQKIITGLQLPVRIHHVYGRDFRSFL